MEYILIQDSTSDIVTTRGGQVVSTTDILSIYPEHRVYALHGAMGAGKTTFIKQLCREMGSTDVVNSPTFAIVNVYEDKDGEEMFHFDCYRLKSASEALDLGIEEYLYSGKYCFIEWPDIIADILPEDTVHINFRVLSDTQRKLEIQSK